MRYKLIAADLDGTLMDDSFHFSPRVKAVVRAAQERGVIVTIATGRGFRPALPFARKLGITAPLICYQGGMVASPEKVLYENTRALDAAQDVIALATERDWDLSVYLDHTIYIRERRHGPDFYTRWFNLPITETDDLAAAITRPPTKFIVTAEAEVADDIESEMQAVFSGRMHIIRSHPLFVEGVPLSTSKGRALAHLAAHLAVPQAQVMAIGDQRNDVDMIAWAGLGVAMGNAVAEVKAVADYIAPPVAEDGAAEAIERFVLASERPIIPIPTHIPRGNS